jgi:uncharacterized protein YjiS (DUF1127 family)
MTTVSIIHTGVLRRTSALGSLLRLPAVWIQRTRQRRELLGLLGQSQHVLQDIGLQRDQMSREALKPFWKA